MTPGTARSSTASERITSRRLAAVTRRSLSAHDLPAAGPGARREAVRQVTRRQATRGWGGPAVDVSLGNLRNTADVRQLSRASGRGRYVRALVAGIVDYLGEAPDETSRMGPMGVQVFTMWRDWPDHARLMDAAVAAGVRSIRVDVGWCSLEEHGRGVISPWYLDRLDATVAAARARGLSLLVTLTCAPSWATGGHLGVLPSDPAEYARVAGYLAARYRGQVAAWEVWNEPDCLDGGCPQGDVDSYVRLLRAAYPAIKAADPAATVVNGGLSGIDLEWIGRMLDAGAAGYMDALALHPYLDPANAAPDTPAALGHTNPYRLTNVDAAHRLLGSRGLGDLPIWFTELGWTTGQTSGSSYDGVSQAQQAAYLTAAVDLIRTRYPYVEQAYWYMLRDRDDSSAYENGFGLLTVDGAPKPAYEALRAANGS